MTAGGQCINKDRNTPFITEVTSCFGAGKADTATSDPSITTMHGSSNSNRIIRRRNTPFIIRIVTFSAAGKADTATSDAQHNHKAQQLQQQLHY